MNFKFSILLMLFTLLGCSTTSEKVVKKENSFAISLDEKNKCMARVVYFKILSQQAKNKYFSKLLNNSSDEELCTKDFQSTMKLMNEHRDKIGIIIEADPDYSQKTDAIISGIKASLKDVVHNQKGGFIIKRVQKRKEKVNQVIADLVLSKKVGLIISWGAEDFVAHIQRWQKGLDVPGIFISNKLEKHANSFHIFPSRKNYALEFIRTLEQKGIKKIAMLTPEHLKTSPLLRILKETVKAKGIEIVHDIEYQKEQYDSYDLACRSIFQIDRVKRKDELELIYEAEKLKAEAQGMQLDEKHVFLPAKTQYDAIFIPDDFKTVLYFTKLFNYYQAKNVQLLGTYQWRSQELLAAGDQMLKGATFIDFLGDYEKLPIEVPKLKNDELVNKGFRTDYKLMGYYTGLISQIALKESKNSKEKITQELKNIKLNDNFISDKKAFQNNQFNWPSFAIEVREKEFHITHSN